MLSSNKNHHRRTHSVDHRRVSSSDESNFSLTLSHNTVTPPESPRSMYKSNPQIDLDAINHHYSSYQRKLSDSSASATPTKPRMPEFPENVLEETDTASQQSPIWQSPADWQYDNDTSRPVTPIVLPQSSTDLLDKYDKKNQTIWGRTLGIFKYKR